MGWWGWGEGPFLQGFLRNRGVWTWFFGWLDVVECVVNVVLMHHTFWPLKMRQVFGIYFGLWLGKAKMRGALDCITR
ncbi:hypothetical protein RBB78_04685 [Tunturiibacter empetritectus]|uniref:hypothetical protein n=1 Tax=Tunturiibacter empetritectus TaxID=3069691 RepID=UPI003D9AE489